MPRFLIANRLSGLQFNASASAESLDAAMGAMKGFADVDKQGGKARRGGSRRTIHSAEADAADMDAWQKTLPPGIIVEPEIYRECAWSFPGSVQNELTYEGPNPVQTGVGKQLSITVRGAGKPLANVKVLVLFASTAGRPPGTRSERVSDRNGKVVLAYDPNLWVPMLALSQPTHGFWGGWHSVTQNEMVIELPVLPQSGPLGWWHYALGASQFVAARGGGIRIGVADTGVGPHPYLSHVHNLGSIINGIHDSSTKAGEDALHHGTHVNGILAARPVVGSGDYAGISPGSDVLSVRVFPAQGPATQGDIAEAIDLLTDNEADLINLSLGGPIPSQIEQDAIIAAMERGALCVAAAGNNAGGPVMFPAAFPQVVAVSAVGLWGTNPPETASAHTLPTDVAKFSFTGLYVADFSNVGTEVYCTGPGVGIISTVPSMKHSPTPYLALDGTSMASPACCAALATALSVDPVYRSLPRDTGRVARAIAVLQASARFIGLSPIFVGRGLLQGAP